MDTIKIAIHWLSYAYYLYIFGYASLFKVFQKESMMQSMQSLGFNKTRTIAIGVFELIGVILILIGIFQPQYKNAGDPDMRQIALINLLKDLALAGFAMFIAANAKHQHLNVD